MRGFSRFYGRIDMTFLKTMLVAAVAVLAPSVAFSDAYKVGDLSIAHPKSFATPPGSVTAAGYMTITNHGDEDDRLISISSDFPRTMLHKSEEQDGVMKMLHQHDGVVIPAGGTVSFEPGGLHVMFMGLKERLKEGEQNDVTLSFEKAGSVDVTFNVEKRKRSTKTNDHSGHGAKKDHSGHSN